MIDRAINVVVLFTVAISLVVFSAAIANAWNSSAVWEKEWAAKPGVDPSQTAERVVTAVRNATKANDVEAVRKLEAFLEENYQPTGGVSVRISWSEFADAAVAASLPLSVNYVRHSRFRLGNRTNHGAA